MARMAAQQKGRAAKFPKVPTGITGLDEITGGGLPKGRPTLLVGGAGSGKTLLGLEFLVRGAVQFHEPGLFVAFEETPEELIQNVKSLGFDLKSLISKKLNSLDHVRIERSEIEETREYDLDAMLGGGGYFRGSTVLISGTAGSGKTSLAAHFVDAASRRGEKSLYFAFEESQSQVIRNMRLIGIDLEPWVKKGVLRIEATRPSLYGLEMHLARMYRAVNEFQPKIVVADPVTDMMSIGSSLQVKSTLMRVIDFLKANGTTALLTSLTFGGDAAEQTEVGISSLIDTWPLVRELESSGERTRGNHVLKSRANKSANVPPNKPAPIWRPRDRLVTRRNKPAMDRDRTNPEIRFGEHQNLCQ